MWFKNFHQLVSKPLWMIFKLQFLGYLGFPFSDLEAIFFLGFCRLVLILYFEAQLMLETCRKHCLEQNPSFFFVFVFRAHLMGFRKLGFVMVLHFMRFLCVFFNFLIFGLRLKD